MRMILRSRETRFSACAAKSLYPFPFRDRNLVKGSKRPISFQGTHSERKINSISWRVFRLNLLV
jgi:hypothetical protein